MNTKSSYPCVSLAKIAILATLVLLTTLLHAEKAATVTIRSDPPGAQIEVNGRSLGVTPFEWNVGNWAINPNKHWATSKHLDVSLVMTLSKDGYVPKTVQLTRGPYRWVSMNGMNSYAYYIFSSTQYDLKLDKVGEFIGENPFNPSNEKGSVATAPTDGSLESLIQHVMRSVVTINTAGGSGSGFFVSSRVVITNRHVVGASTSVRVMTSSGKSYESSSIFIAPDHDLDGARQKLSGNAR